MIDDSAHRSRHRSRLRVTLTDDELARFSAAARFFDLTLGELLRDAAMEVADDYIEAKVTGAPYHLPDAPDTGPRDHKVFFQANDAEWERFVYASFLAGQRGGVFLRNAALMVVDEHVEGIRAIGGDA